MTTPPPDVAGLERAFDTALLALTAAEMRGEIAGPDDFRLALIRTYPDWLDEQVAPLVGTCDDGRLPAAAVLYVSALWSGVAVDYLQIIEALLFQIEQTTGKPAVEALRELRERLARDQAGAMASPTTLAEA